MKEHIYAVSLNCNYLTNVDVKSLMLELRNDVSCHAVDMYAEHEMQSSTHTKWNKAYEFTYDNSLVVSVIPNLPFKPLHDTRN